MSSFTAPPASESLTDRVEGAPVTPADAKGSYGSNGSPRAGFAQSIDRKGIGMAPKQTKKADAIVAPVEAPAIVAVRNAPNARPETVANALGISGKIVRGYLRSTFTRPIEAKGTTWVLTQEQANATLDHFIARRSSVVPSNEDSAA